MIPVTHLAALGGASATAHMGDGVALVCKLIMVVFFFKKRFPFPLTDSCLFSVKPWAFFHIAEEE